MFGHLVCLVVKLDCRELFAPPTVVLLVPVVELEFLKLELLNVEAFLLLSNLLSFSKNKSSASSSSTEVDEIAD